MPPITVTPEPVWRNGKDFGVTESLPWSAACVGEKALNGQATKVARPEWICSLSWDGASTACSS